MQELQVHVPAGVGMGDWRVERLSTSATAKRKSDGMCVLFALPPDTEEAEIANEIALACDRALHADETKASDCASVRPGDTVYPDERSSFRVGKVEIAVKEGKPASMSGDDTPVPLFSADVRVLIDGKPIDWAYIKGVVLTIRQDEFLELTFEGFPRAVPAGREIYAIGSKFPVALAPQGEESSSDQKGAE